MRLESRVATAGALVRLGDRFIFMVGPNPAGDGLGVVRLGGHREPGESSAGCALRELMEEASLAVRLLTPPATYAWGSLSRQRRTGPRQLERLVWTDGPPAPLLVTERHDRTLSVLYLAEADGPPRPAAEAQGLLLPDRDWLVRLCAEPISLARYLEGGGQAILRSEMNRQLLLQPSLHVRLLDQILTRHPSLNSA